MTSPAPGGVADGAGATAGQAADPAEGDGATADQEAAPAVASSPPEPALIVLRPGRAPLGRYVTEVWRYRDLGGVLARREIKLRYRQTVLGGAWVILQPLLSAGILSFVFGRIARLPTDGVPAFLFTFAGFLYWSVFASSVTRGTTSLIGNAALISKIYFPRLLLPLSTAWAVIVDFAVVFVLLLAMLAVEGLLPDARILLVPVWVGLLLLVAQGLGAFFATLSVSYRDVPLIVPVAVQLGLFASPVAYSASVVPAEYVTLYNLNPVAPLLGAFRWSVLGTAAPPGRFLALAAVEAVALFLAGSALLQRGEAKFADVV